MKLPKDIAGVFSATLEQTDEDREDFLKRECGGDDKLIAEIRQLLAEYEHVKTNDFLSAPALELEAEHLGASDADDQRTGQTFGRYRIIERIGAGGMGAIYLAARTDDFEKQVAVKIIKRGMDTDAILERFRNERQILANLEHPNIAHLIDGGTTGDGLPFFVMEYVEGVPISEYCETTRLPEYDRLVLFRKVCSAVQFAHQKLVVHRDLKPSNILVTTDGEPKLLDFGIAKLLNSTGAEQTQTNMRVHTPAYASPEQLRGEMAATSSDVYSLGLILSEILGGGRKMDGSAKIGGDLKNIVAMSLHEEQERRYGSVEAFSEDVRRYLQSLPVIARQDSFSYRTSKFVKRNALAVAISALFVLSLIVGLAATLWQFRTAQAERSRVERRFNDVRALVNNFISELNDELEKVRGNTKARELLVKRTLEYLDNESLEAGGDTALERELATAYIKIGDIQGNSYYQNLGDTTQALESYKKSLKIRLHLVRDNPANAEMKSELAHTYESIGDSSYDKGDLNASLENYQKAVEIVELLSAAAPDDVNTKLYLAQLYTGVGDLKDMGGTMSFKDLAGSFEQQNKALAIREELFASDPENREFNIYLNQSYQRMANLNRMKGDFDEESKYLGKLQPIVEKMIAREPDNPTRKRDSALCYGKFTIYFREAGDFEKAAAYLEKSLALRGTLAGGDKTDVRGQRDLANGYSLKGELLTEMGDAPGALESFRKTLTIYEDLAAVDDSNKDRQRDLASGFVDVGNALLKTHDSSGALIQFNRAVKISDTFPHDDLENQSNKARIYEGIGSALMEKGDVKGAAENLKQSVTLREADALTDKLNVIVSADLAKLYSKMGQTIRKIVSADRVNLDDSRVWFARSDAIWTDLQARNSIRKIDNKFFLENTSALSLVLSEPPSQAGGSDANYKSTSDEDTRRLGADYLSHIRTW